MALILRSRTQQLQSLQAIHTGLLVTAVVAVGVAIVLGFAVARTIAQPLAAITGVMREVAATGDLTRKIALRENNRWDDGDARLLATTFNTLTDSIAQFQRALAIDPNAPHARNNIALANQWLSAVRVAPPSPESPASPPRR